ncbi:hypothetical protein ENHYD8BJ_140012 [Enhydrobacter sp. 8BJ]|nr:hypothetical protein ENHYD8BJ_140012 [Enhydrobacter sp. 8BJ]
MLAYFLIVNRFLEVVIQMAVYAGVPACMNGLTAYREAMAATDHELPNI